MSIKVLIAHAKGEAELAEKLAKPIRLAGYEATHEGTLLVGESIIAEATRLLREGAPLIICGTTSAMGSRWTRKLADAARATPGARIFAVQMDEDADVEVISLDEMITSYWKSPPQAELQLIAALQKWYPLGSDSYRSLHDHDLESRYRELALKACDIIDLANLPEDDRHLASRELELRRLYVALRMRLELQIDDEADDETLKALELRRSSAWGSKVLYSHNEEENLVSLGERLEAVKQLIVLGDPGAGKSTLLRWLATAYLLRLQKDPDWSDLPDIKSLPDTGWLPILIRCRDLPPEADTLDTMLHHSLRKSELGEEQCEPMRRLLRAKLEKGEALLLVDGLDEITDPGARARFADQLTKIHRAISKSPMVITSRIVGYREMGYRIRSGFEHLTVADLTKGDKDEFAYRWCALTERAERSNAAAIDLIHDIHSSDRIERLTGNPMLLTTMALIKRKIGRLPQRRVDLYEKAVEVLLNWRSVVDAALDPREALPQLEYLAHAMCAEGIQQVREDQALELLRQVREDFPHIYPLQQHSPEEFLALLERRTGLVMQSGHTRHNGRSVPVYEFRHLTLQEYLAGVALVQGHYKGRDKNQTQAEAIRPLAGQVGEAYSGGLEKNDVTVVENWREALRLCLAASNDDMVDQSLLAILNPLEGEEDGAKRARAVLAVLCLADEPNVSDEVAHTVLREFTLIVNDSDGEGPYDTSLNAAATNLATSRWSPKLSEYLLDEFFAHQGESRNAHAGLYAVIQDVHTPESEEDFAAWLTETESFFSTCREQEAAGIALTLMQAAFSNKNCATSILIAGLINRLSGTPAMSHASAWALGWMNERNYWSADASQLGVLIFTITNPKCDSEVLFWISKILLNNPSPLATEPLLNHLPTSPTRTKRAILETLGAIGGASIHQILKTYLTDTAREIRCSATKGLSYTCENEIDRLLLCSEFSSDSKWGQGIDPASKITSSRIKRLAQRFEKTPREIWKRYKALIDLFGLELKISKNPPRTKTPQTTETASHTASL